MLFLDQLLHFVPLVLVISVLFTAKLILLIIVLLLLVASGLSLVAVKIYYLFLVLLDYSILFVYLLLQSPSDLEHIIIVLSDVFFDALYVLLSV